MRLNWAIAAVLGVQSLVGGIASASQMGLVRIEAEKYPGQVYTLGIDLDNSRRAVGVYYQDPYNVDESKHMNHFSFAQLQNPQVLVQSSALGQVFDVVKIGFQGDVITVYFAQDARYDSWLEKKFRLQCDSRYNNCVITDLDTQHTVNSIYLTNHWTRVYHVKTVITGVDSIESR